MNSSVANNTGGGFPPSSFFLIQAETIKKVSLAFYCGIIPLVALIGLTGNSLTLVILVRRKPMTTTSRILMALAISDNLALVSCSIFVFIRGAKILNPPLGEWIRIRSVPIFENYLRGVPYRISNILTTIMAFERATAVFFPLKIRHTWTGKVMTRCIFFAYMFVPCIMLPALLEYQTTEVSRRNMTVTILSLTAIGENEQFYDVYHTTDMVIFRIMPFFLVMISNSAICIGLCRLSRTRPSSTRNLSFQRELQVTKMLFVVILMFFVCNCPGTLLYLWMNFDPDYRLPRIRNNGYILGLIISLFMTTLNSSMNFLIYIVTSDAYRKDYQQLVMCKRPDRVRQPITSLRTQSVQISVVG